MRQVAEKIDLSESTWPSTAQRAAPLSMQSNRREIVAQIFGREIEYFYDSARMLGYFCLDQSKSGVRPGIVLVHDAFGVGEYMKRRADAVAELGYAVLAADIWGDGAQLREESEIRPMIGRFARDRKTWMARLQEAHKVLAAQPNVEAASIASIGYCFGGASVLEYLRTVGSVKGVVSFHGGLDLVGADWSSAPSKEGKALILTGAEDPMAKPSVLLELQDNLTKASLHWEVNIYGNTKHGFTRPDSDRANKPQVVAYNAQSERRSWLAMCRFLDEIFSA
jgi:dienelactone hydrolase